MTGFRRAAGGGPNPALFVVTFVARFVAALALAFLARASGAESVGDGVLLGLVAGIGLAMTVLGVTQMYESRPARLHAPYPTRLSGA